MATGSNPIRLNLIVQSPTTSEITGIEQLADRMAASMNTAMAGLTTSMDGMFSRLQAHLSTLSGTFNTTFTQGFKSIESGFATMDSRLESILQKMARIRAGSGGAGGAGAGGTGAGGSGGGAGGAGWNPMSELPAGLAPTGAYRQRITKNGASQVDEYMNAAGVQAWVSNSAINLNNPRDLQAQIAASVYRTNTRNAINASDPVRLARYGPGPQAGGAGAMPELYAAHAAAKTSIQADQNTYAKFLLGLQKNSQDAMGAIGNDTKKATPHVDSLISSMVRLSAAIYAVKNIWRGFDNVFIEPFKKMYGAVFDATEKNRKFEISISGVLGGMERARLVNMEMYRTAANSPLTMDELQKSAEAIAFSPGMSRRISMAKSPRAAAEQIAQYGSMVGRMALIDPAAGVYGANLSIREMFEGDLISLRRRFGIQPAIIARMAPKIGGRSATQSDLKSDPLLAEQGLKAFIDTFIPPEAFEKTQSLLSVRLEKLRDTLTLGLSKIGESGVYHGQVNRYKKLTDELFKYFDTKDFEKQADRISEALDTILNNLWNGVRQTIERFTGVKAGEGVSGAVDMAAGAIDRLAELSAGLPELGNKLGAGFHAVAIAVEGAVNALGDLGDYLPGGDARIRARAGKASEGARKYLSDLTGVESNPSSQYWLRGWGKFKSDVTGNSWDVSQDELRDRYMQGDQGVGGKTNPGFASNGDFLERVAVDLKNRFGGSLAGGMRATNAEIEAYLKMKGYWAPLQAMRSQNAVNPLAMKGGSGLAVSAGQMRDFAYNQAFGTDYRSFGKKVGESQMSYAAGVSPDVQDIQKRLETATSHQDLLDKGSGLTAKRLGETFETMRENFGRQRETAAGFLEIYKAFSPLSPGMTGVPQAMLDEITKKAADLERQLDSRPYELARSNQIEAILGGSRQEMETREKVLGGVPAAARANIRGDATMARAFLNLLREEGRKSNDPSLMGLTERQMLLRGGAVYGNMIPPWKNPGAMGTISMGGMVSFERQTLIEQRPLNEIMENLRLQIASLPEEISVATQRGGFLPPREALAGGGALAAIQGSVASPWEQAFGKSIRAESIRQASAAKTMNLLALAYDNLGNAQKQLAATSPDDPGKWKQAATNVDLAADAIQNLESQLKQLNMKPLEKDLLDFSVRVRDAFESNLGKGLDDMIWKVGSLRDAAVGFAHDVTRAFTAMVSKNITNAIFDNVFGGMFGMGGGGDSGAAALTAAGTQLMTAATMLQSAAINLGASGSAGAAGAAGSAGAGSSGGGGGLFGWLGRLFGGGSSSGSVDAKATGGIFPGSFLPFKAFSAGGIADRPTFGLIGEGGRPEAIVPLSGGRSIPVEMKGGGGGDTYIVADHEQAYRMGFQKNRDKMIDVFAGDIARGGKSYKALKAKR